MHEIVAKGSVRQAHEASLFSMLSLLIVFPPAWQGAFDPKGVVTDIYLAGKLVHDR